MMAANETNVPIGPHAARAVAMARQLHHFAADFDDLMADALEHKASTDGVIEQETRQALERAEEKVWAMARLYLECEKAGDYGGVFHGSDGESMDTDETEAAATGGEAPAETKAEAPTTAGRRGALWDLWDEHDFIGYLVTDPDDHDRFIAMRRVVDGRGEQEAARKAIRAVAQDIDADGGDWDAIDFRSYGKLDSPLPMPAFVYAWRLAPFESSVEWATIRPAPFCRFRLAKMVAQHNALRFSKEEHDRYRFDCVGMNDGDGTGIEEDVGLDTVDVPLP